MVMAEKGSLAKRSDIGNKVRLFRKWNQFLNGNGNTPLKVEVDNNDIIVQLSQNGNDRLSPQTFDISFGSNSMTDNVGQTSAAKMSPASMLSSISSTMQSPNHTRSKILQQIPGRNWSPIAGSYQRIDTSGNGTSSILFDFKSSEASSPALMSTSLIESGTKQCDNLDLSNKNVVLRRPKREQWSQCSLKGEAGKHLKAALDKICRSTTPAEISELQNKHVSAIQSMVDSNEALDHYIKEVFWQLDHNQSGTVLKEDFDLLCEVLSIAPATPARNSFRNSGMEWLSSYMPRANSPLSPLRFDRLSDVKYRNPHNLTMGSVSHLPDNQHNHCNFLFTLGPRPFWELWPMRKGRKKSLTVEEFKALLLERWSKSHGRNSHLMLGPNLSSLSSALGNPRKYHRVRSTQMAPSPSSHPTTANTDSDEMDSKTQRIMKRVAKVARRYLVIQKMTQLNRNPSSATTVSANNESQFSSSKTLNPSADIFNTDLIENANNILIRDVPSVKFPKSLEGQIVRQQQEITNLKSIIHGLRSSLQLSDAQNLVLQVLLKKMAKPEVHPTVERQSSQHLRPEFLLPHNETFQSHIMESEKQLENLVRELKAMSQTKYPTTNTLMNQHLANGNGNGSSLGSFHQNELIIEDEFRETSKALKVAQDELRATQQDLRNAVSQLKQQEAESHNTTSTMETFYKALEKAQKEVNEMWSQLEDAQKALLTTNEELQFTKQELFIAQSQLTHSDRMLLETELRLSLLMQSRQSLVFELQATRKLLSSSLNLVHDLERESQKVPILEKQFYVLKRVK